MTPSMQTTVRFVVIGAVWGFAALMLTAIARSSFMPMMIVLGATVVIGATLVSLGLLRGTGARSGTGQASASTGKPKRDDADLDPLDMLTEEDIAELREEIKQNLRERMRNSQDGELNSLDALLAEQEKNARGQR